MPENLERVDGIDIAVTVDIAERRGSADGRAALTLRDGQRGHVALDLQTVDRVHVVVAVDVALRRWAGSWDRRGDGE